MTLIFCWTNIIISLTLRIRKKYNRLAYECWGVTRQTETWYRLSSTRLKIEWNYICGKTSCSNIFCFTYCYLSIRFSNKIFFYFDVSGASGQQLLQFQNTLVYTDAKDEVENLFNKKITKQLVSDPSEAVHLKCGMKTM